MNSPVLDTENNGSIVLNEDKLAGLRLFPSSKGDTVINGIGTGEGVEHAIDRQWLVLGTT